MFYGAIAITAVTLIFLIAILWNKSRNGNIMKNGLETDAVVTGMKANTSFDEHGFSYTSSYTFYVTYRTIDGQKVAAKLGSGKNIDFSIAGGWDKELYIGRKVRIMYLPQKPKYVIMLHTIKDSPKEEEKEKID